MKHESAPTWDLRKRLAPIQPAKNIDLYILSGSCDCLVQEALSSLSESLGVAQTDPQAAVQRIAIPISTHYKELANVSDLWSTIPIIPQRSIYTLQFANLTWQPPVAQFFEDLAKPFPLKEQRWLVVHNGLLDTTVRSSLTQLAKQGLRFAEILCLPPYKPNQMVTCLRRYSKTLGLDIEPDLLDYLETVPTNQLSLIYQYLHNAASSGITQPLTLSDFQTEIGYSVPHFQQWLTWLAKGKLPEIYTALFENTAAFQPLLLFIRSFQYSLTARIKKLYQEPDPATQWRLCRQFSQALQSLLEAEKCLKGAEQSGKPSDSVWSHLTKAGFYAGIGYHLAGIKP